MFQLLPVSLIPLFIFLARITDVSLGTIRIVMVSRGFKWRAAILGFFEVLLWLIVVSEILKNLDHWQNYLAYAGGFAAGTYVGMYIEGMLKVGTIIVRIITPNPHEDLVQALKNAGFMITVVDGHGGESPVKIIFTLLKRRRWNEVVSIIETHDSEAFYSSEDVKFASSTHALEAPNGKRTPVNKLLGLRKGI